MKCRTLWGGVSVALILPFYPKRGSPKLRKLRVHRNSRKPMTVSGRLGATTSCGELPGDDAVRFFSYPLAGRPITPSFGANRTSGGAVGCIGPTRLTHSGHGTRMEQTKEIGGLARLERQYCESRHGSYPDV